MHEESPKRVLLVGATGYAGRKLANYLLTSTDVAVILVGRSRSKLDDLQSTLPAVDLARPALALRARKSSICTVVPSSSNACSRRGQASSRSKGSSTKRSASVPEREPTPVGAVLRSYHCWLRRLTTDAMSAQHRAGYARNSRVAPARQRKHGASPWYGYCSPQHKTCFAQ